MNEATFVVRSFGRVVPVPRYPTRLGLLSDGDDGGQIWDWKRKSLVVELPHWTGQCTSDGRLGLYVPTRGGLELIDMRTGHVVHTLIGRVAEGVFTTQTLFTSNDTHVIHFHSGRSSVRVFRVADGKLVRNFSYMHSALSLAQLSSRASLHVKSVNMPTSQCQVTCNKGLTVSFVCTFSKCIGECRAVCVAMYRTLLTTSRL